MYSQSDVILYGLPLRLVMHNITVIELYIIVFIHFINMFIMSLLKQLLISLFHLWSSYRCFSLFVHDKQLYFKLSLEFCL